MQNKLCREHGRHRISIIRTYYKYYLRNYFSTKLNIRVNLHGRLGVHFSALMKASIDSAALINRRFQLRRKSLTFVTINTSM